MSDPVSDPVLGPAPAVAWTPAPPDGVALAVVPLGPPYVLHGSAAVIWAAVTEGGTADDVVRRVSATTGADPAVVGPDVHDLLALLERRGLLAYSSSSASR